MSFYDPQPFSDGIHDIAIGSVSASGTEEINGLHCGQWNYEYLSSKNRKCPATSAALDETLFFFDEWSCVVDDGPVMARGILLLRSPGQSTAGTGRTTRGAKWDDSQFAPRATHPLGFWRIDPSGMDGMPGGHVDGLNGDRSAGLSVTTKLVFAHFGAACCRFLEGINSTVSRSSQCGSVTGQAIANGCDEIGRWAIAALGAEESGMFKHEGALHVGCGEDGPGSI